MPIKNEKIEELKSLFASACGSYHSDPAPLHFSYKATRHLDNGKINAIYVVQNAKNQDQPPVELELDALAALYLSKHYESHYKENERFINFTESFERLHESLQELGRAPIEITKARINVLRAVCERVSPTNVLS